MIFSAHIFYISTFSVHLYCIFSCINIVWKVSFFIFFCYTLWQDVCFISSRFPKTVSSTRQGTLQSGTPCNVPTQRNEVSNENKCTQNHIHRTDGSTVVHPIADLHPAAKPHARHHTGFRRRLFKCLHHRSFCFLHRNFYLHIARLRRTSSFFQSTGRLIRPGISLSHFSPGLPSRNMRKRFTCMWSGW